MALVAVAAVTGAGAGLAAFVLRWLIGVVTEWVCPAESDPRWMWAVVPALGIVLAVVFQRCVLRHNLSMGGLQLHGDLSEHRYRLPGYVTYGPVIAGGITLGFGGSAGGEGPIAYTGAAIGSNLGRLTGLQPSALRIIIGCGAAAGIAGIFKSPVGGALFTLEVMRMGLTTMSVLAVLVATVCGALTCSACTGFTTDLAFNPPVGGFDPSMLGWIALLGVWCGVYSVYYNSVMGMMRSLFKRLGGGWLTALTGAAVLAATVCIFPDLYGEGYGIVEQLINGDFTAMGRGSAGWLTVTVVAMLALKSFAAVSTNSAGAVAGDFAPTIFAGALAGTVFAWGVNEAFGASLPVALFALMGTAGVFAGAIHAPLMAIFLVAEMTGGFAMFPGLVVCSAMSYAAVKVITPLSVYTTTAYEGLIALLSGKKPLKHY